MCMCVSSSAFHTVMDGGGGGDEVFCCTAVRTDLHLFHCGSLKPMEA